MNTSRKLLIETSEEGRKIIDYAMLTDKDIDRKIRRYEKKYGMPYARCNKEFDCDSALPWESGDLIEWECLAEEREDRLKRGKKKEIVYK